MEIESHQLDRDRIVAMTSSGTLEFAASEVMDIEKLSDDASVPGSAPQTKSETVDSLLTEAANEQGLPPNFVRSVAKVESGLKQDAVSPKGAIGLMQLMPGTAADLNALPSDAGQNARGGAKYLRQLLFEYKGNAALALAAYNAGPAAVEKYHGIPPYPETRRYIVRVLKELAAEQAKEESPQRSLSSVSNPKNR